MEHQDWNRLILGVGIANRKAIFIFDTLFDGSKFLPLYFQTPEDLAKEEEKIDVYLLEYDFWHKRGEEMLGKGEAGAIPVIVFSSKISDLQTLSNRKDITFLKLPFQIETLEDTVRDLLAKGSLKKRKQNILFVDDSTLQHRMVDAVLSGEGFELFHAYDGKEGFETALMCRPDLIISDIEMPRMNGYEFCAAIKKDAGLARIPVMMLSSLDDGIHFDKGFDVGADDYLTKPIDSEELLSRVNYFFKTDFTEREKVLVCDDSKMVRSIAVQALSRQGFVTVEAENGEDALEVLEKNEADLVIVDQVMPGMDGRTFVRNLRKIRKYSALPVIMLSGRDTKIESIKNRSAGVNEFIAKPFSGDKLVSSVERLLAEYRFKKEEAALKQYVSESTHRQAVKSARVGGMDHMAAENKHVTILFSDIQGFTLLCESLDPAEIVNMLNEYFDRMVDIIKNNGGSIDKFIGDSIMALFDGKENGAYLACKAALEMIESMEVFRKGQKHQIHIRIGINSGEVVMGDLGSRFFRRDYTVIGDNVNIAQRLESSCPVDGVLISEATRSLVAEHCTVETLKSLTLKGRNERVLCHLLKEIF